MFMPQRCTKTFYESLKEGKIMATRCIECGSVEYPPMPSCNTCGAIDMEWIELSGIATMQHMYRVPDKKMYAPFNSLAPYYEAVGTLEEGAPFTGILLGVDPADEVAVRAKLPLKVKAEPISFENFCSVGWRIIE